MIVNLFKICVMIALMITELGYAGSYNREGPTNSNESKLSFDLLHAAVSNPQLGLTSVEKVLAWVTANYPDYLKHYTLMRESLSAQDSSDSHPRAIVFGEDGSFILTFNGTPEQRGFNRIEMIQFREDIANTTSNQRRSAFEFREIQFYDDERFPSVSKANPDSCKQCHYAPSRPIWEPYDEWPGAYGERDDAIIDYANEKYPSPPATPDNVAFHNKQLSGYRSFQQIQSTHPRYKWLVPPSASVSSVTPYAPGVRFQYSKYRPNLALTDRLVRFQAQNIAQQIVNQQSCNEVYSELLLAKLMECSDYYEFSVLEKSLDDVIAEQWENLRGDSTPEFFLPWTSFSSNNPQADKTRLLSLMGIEASDYSMSRVPIHWDFFEGADFLADWLVADLFERLAQHDPTLGTFTRPFDGYRHTVDNSDNDRVLCGNLYQRAQTKLQDLPATFDCRNESEAVSSAEVVHMCASCHEQTSTGAPTIAFSNQAMLQANAPLIETILERIQAENSPLQMPPNRPLSEKEKRALKRYLGVSTPK